tara:strand:- start:89 stop:301 length:213 start_codon:yes stop_codon:yes gene_type:complete
VKVIDLHGFKHENVTDFIIEACAKYDPPFIVITGKSTQMKKIVSFAAARFKLSVRDTIDNPGRVIVYEGG